jgi:hypothetical protein
MMLLLILLLAVSLVGNVVAVVEIRQRTAPCSALEERLTGLLDQIDAERAAERERMRRFSREVEQYKVPAEGPIKKLPGSKLP